MYTPKKMLGKHLEAVWELFDGKAVELSSESAREEREA